MTDDFATPFTFLREGSCFKDHYLYKQFAVASSAAIVVIEFLKK